ncbi:MAG: hypothetical protein OEX07_05165 [Gammaproteobacteria bacterium]|nr:hypothetical protein [Gammaproteobacteria bacterium]
MKKLRNVAITSMLLCSTNSFAAFNADAILGPTFKTVAENLVAATSYKAVAPGEPLGITGFDIGAEASVTSVKGAADLAAAFGTDISIIPTAKLHVHKGLPMGIDVGAVWMPEIQGISFWGGELRYSFVSGNIALPAVAVRGAYTKFSASPLSVSNTSVEATVSKGLLMFTPFLGIGNVWGNASVTGLTDQKPSFFKWFAGLNMNMGLMNLAYEMDNTGGFTTHSGKLGFRF